MDLRGAAILGRVPFPALKKQYWAGCRQYPGVGRRPTGSRAASRPVYNKTEKGRPFGRIARAGKMPNTASFNSDSLREAGWKPAPRMDLRGAAILGRVPFPALKKQYWARCPRHPVPARSRRRTRPRASVAPALTPRARSPRRRRPGSPTTSSGSGFAPRTRSAAGAPRSRRPKPRFSRTVMCG